MRSKHESIDSFSFSQNRELQQSSMHPERSFGWPSQAQNFVSCSFKQIEICHFRSKKLLFGSPCIRSVDEISTKKKIK